MPRLSASRTSGLARLVSGGREDLDRQRIALKTDGCRQRAARSAGRIVKWLEVGRGPLISGDSPLTSTRPYPSPHGKLATRGSILDVAVREPQQEDRRCRDTDSVLLRDLGARLRRRGQRSLVAFAASSSFHRVDMNGQDISIGYACDRPERAPTPEPVPDGWTFTPSQVVLVVAIGKTDHECSSGDYAPPSRVNGAMPEPSRSQTHLGRFTSQVTVRLQISPRCFQLL